MTSCITYPTVWSSLDSFLNRTVSLEALIGMAALLVAVLIPLAIFMIDSRTDNAFSWDKAVILSKILNAPRLLASLFLLSAPLLFWKSAAEVKPIILVLYTIGVFFLVQSMVKAYKWLKVSEKGYFHTYRTRMRIEYLRTLKEGDMRAIWSLTWSDTKGRALVDDRQLVNEFVTQLENMKDKAGAGSIMLREFMAYIDQLDISDPEVYEKVLRLSMKWANHLIHDNTKDDENNPMQFRHTARRLFYNLETRSLNDSFISFLFYKTVKEYITETKANVGEAVRHIATDFFPAAEKANDTRSVWDEFPEDWKVTLANLTGDQNGASAAMLNGYMHWITTRNLLTSSKDYKYDDFADEVTRNLFPSVELIMWSDLLILHWSPYGSKEGEEPIHAQVRNFIELDKTFGHIGRVTEFTSAENSNEVFRKQYGDQQNEILELNKTFNIYPYFRNPTELRKYIKAAKSLKFDDGSTQESKRLRLVETLKKVEQSLPKPKPAQKKQTKK